MRTFLHDQLKIGETDIGSIWIDDRSRDEIPRLLRGLQHIYCTPEINEKVFAILQNIVPKGTDVNNGRPGMELWKILVLGSVRLLCNWDYDKLKEIADNHKTLRQMLGHGLDDDEKSYPIQTLKDNIHLLTPEALDRINQVVVEAGHQLLGKKKEPELKVRCDSFVVETDVHFPTDISLLFDSVRKAITLTARLYAEANLDGWRQSKHLIRKVKRLFDKVRRLKHSTSKDDQKRTKRETVIKNAYLSYLSEVEALLERLIDSLSIPGDFGADSAKQILDIGYYISHAVRQTDQVYRRAILDETIPHAEKLFSIFEPHTEWISKGKAGVPQELGLPVCIVEDQHGFILNHHVMQGETDVEIAVPLMMETAKKFPNLSSCSFDKGFHSPANRIKLGRILDKVILPKKGKLSAQDRDREHTDIFRHLRRQHSAVESAINALENHGLDRCPDHGIDGFRRYVALSFTAYNLHKLGAILQRKERKRKRRSAA